MPELRVADIIDGKGAPFGALFTYPLTMRDYEAFAEAKSCLTIMQAALRPIELATMPYLNMLCVLNDSENELLVKLSRVLSLSLRIEEEQITILPDRERQSVSLCFLDENGNPIETVSALRFSALRRQIAEQNHLELPNEKANLEILQSEKDLAELHSMGLSYNFQSLFFSVATACHLSSKQMLEMTIYEFEERNKAISRLENYRIYTQAEMSGMVTFKGGSPCPSWCFDKVDNTHGTIPLAQFKQQVGDVIQDRTAT